MTLQSTRLTIRGRVQGVGYRAWAVDLARRLGLAGWARNRRDGSVEIQASGAPEAIEALAAACRRGPPAARVTAVDASSSEDDGAHVFEVRPTL